MRRLALVPILITAFLFPPAASALGLGDIELQSALNQRLDAEIPLRGVPPGQADDITVTLASQQAFQDVGLPRPYSLTKLRFRVKERGDGGYYVHVSSTEAVVEPFLSFLVEVDWEGGNLLREYTVLLDPPMFATSQGEDAGGSAASEAAGTGQADAAGVPGEIERDTAPEARDASTTRQEQPEQAESRKRKSGDFDDEPVFLQVEREEEEAEQRAAEERARAREQERKRAEAAAREAETEPYESGTGSGSADADVADRAEGEYGPVRKGETLWRIARRLKSGDVTVQQMMLALLRYNPEAFGGGNINRLRQGYVLRVPSDRAVREISARRAVAQVSEQNAMWQEWRRQQAGGETRQAAREESADQASASAAQATGSGEDAKLEIVGSKEGGASSDEEASATSGGEESASQQLKLVREQLESARMEKSELQSRVSELEQTVDKMEQLITLRENKLNELEEQLKQYRAERGEAEAEPGTADDAGDDEDEQVASAAGTTDGGESGGAGAGDGGGETGGEEAAGTADDGAATAAESETAQADEAGAGTADESAAGEEATAAADTTAEETAGAETTGQQAGEPEVVTTRTEPGQKGWLDSILGVLGGIAATATSGGLFAGPLAPGVLGLGVIVILLLVWVLVKRRQASGQAEDETAQAAPVVDDAESDGDWGEVDLGQMNESEGVVTQEVGHEDTQQTQAAAEEAESSFMDESLDLGDLDADEDETVPATQGVDEEQEDEGEKDDTIAEADVYLAYGLYQQAEDLLRLALRESPDRTDYQEKLLETLYGAGRNEDFVTEAHNLQQMLGGQQGRLWQRVVAMGKEVAPNDDMFSGAEDPGVDRSQLKPSKPQTTDFELDADGGDVELDFGFDEEEATPSEQPATGESSEEDEFSETMMLDTGDLGSFDSEEETAAAGTGTEQRADESRGAEESDDLEFDLGDLEEFGAEETRDTSGDASGDDWDYDLADFEETSDEQPGAKAGGGEGAAQAQDSSTGASHGEGAESSEDLEFDLSDFESEFEETVDATAESTADATGEPEAAAEEDPEATVAATGRADLDLGSLDSGDATDETAASGPSGGQSGASEAPGAGEADDLEFDLGELDTESPGHHEDSTADSSGSVSLEGAEESDDDVDAFDFSDWDTGEETTGEDTDESAGADLDAEFAGLAETGEAETEPETAASGAETDTGRAATSTAASAEASEDALEVDLGDFERTETRASGESTSDAETSSDGGDMEATVAGGIESSEDAATGDVEASEEDEYDTMLDLAKAYMDMGDKDSASNALEEVIEAGSDSQKKEARQLLESVQ